jgi:hypothetical protein
VAEGIIRHLRPTERDFPAGSPVLSIAGVPIFSACGIMSEFAFFATEPDPEGKTCAGGAGLW